MAAPSYTTDLTTIVDFDGTPSSPTVAEPTTGWTAGRSPTTDTDFPIQSTNHASLTMNTTGKAGILCTNASTFTWTSGDYLFGWIVWLAPGAIDSITNGGMAMLCGSSASAYKVYYIGGNSSGSYPYGGWQNFAVDPTMAYDEIFGSPSDYYVVGAGANVVSAVAKGNPLGFDVFRYGRGEFRIAGGESGNYATFSGMASTNDASSARWGLFQAVAGGYKFKGLMYFGYGSLTEFTDSNKSIVIDDSKYVQTDFNRIEIHNASSIITWANISITSLSTVSPGTLEVIDNATLNFDSCTFTDMSTFIFQSNSAITNTTFRRCGQITSGGGTFTGSLVTASTVAVDTAALVWNVATDTNGYLDDTKYVKGTNAHHAIELGISSPTTVTLSGITYTGFSVSNNQNDSTILVSRTSGVVTINITGGGDTPTYKSAGATVVINNSVAVSVIVKDTAGYIIENVRVGIYVTADDTEILNALTNASGVVGTSYDYLSDTDIYIRARKASSGDTKYIDYSSTGTITSTGLSATITLIEDTVVTP